MIQVGVTGGIGSGKTTVCGIFEHLGIPVYYADLRSKELIQEDVKLVEEIKRAFGRDLYDSENKLDKAALASIVFKDKKKLQQLNSIVHPAVVNDYNYWITQQKDQAYIIKESALLFESGTYKNLDLIICVYAPLEMRLERIKDRDKLKDEDVISRMESQLPDNEKMRLSDYVIFNDMKQPLISQVLSLHHELSNSLI